MRTINVIGLGKISTLYSYCDLRLAIILDFGYCCPFRHDINFTGQNLSKNIIVLQFWYGFDSPPYNMVTIYEIGQRISLWFLICRPHLAFMTCF